MSETPKPEAAPEAAAPAASDAPANGPVRRKSGEGAQAAPAPAAMMAAGARWLLLVAVGAAALWPIAHRITAEFDEYVLTQASDNDARDLLVDGLRSPGGANRMEILSELALDLAGEETAEAAARAALAADDTRAFVWARLAWLITQRAGTLNEEALQALSRSMEACPLCNEELIRWRFNFVLAHWREMPDALRRSAFEHADMLRWRGENAAFLAEMRIKALREGIPFDAYRSNVDTPVRSWDLGPAAQTERSPA